MRYFDRLNIDGIRLAIGLLVTQVLNVLTLLEIISLDIDQLAGINTLTGTVLMLVFYLVKPEVAEPPVS